MAQAVASEADFIAAVREHQSATAVAHVLKMDSRNVLQRIARLEAKHGAFYFNPDSRSPRATLSRHSKIPERLVQEVDNATMVVFSDAHYWPEVRATAHEALVSLLPKLRATHVIANGDVLDGATVSRHGRIGWDKRPSVSDELRAVQVSLAEIEAVAPGAAFIRTIGNHDIRFDTRLAEKAGEFEDVPGFRLRDHLPAWEETMSFMVNNHTLIKHRIRNGIHAAYSNVQAAHISTVTGHLHSLKVTPVTSMTPVNGGNLYGVDTGTLADVYGPQFDYVEDGPRNWRSGFVVLTFRGGWLMPPELCQVVGDGAYFFRGERFRA